MYTEELVEKIYTNLTNNTLPQFIIIKGGYGINTAALLKEKLTSSEINIVCVGNKINDVRDIISSNNIEIQKNIFVIEDGNKLSRFAVNALLKITEEPEKNTYIVLCVHNTELVLETILSRACVYEIKEYNLTNMQQYAKSLGKTFTREESRIVGSLCDNYSHIDILVQYDIIKYFNYINLIWKSINKVSLGNALNIINKLKLKEDGDGYDINFFLHSLKKVLLMCSIPKIKKNKLHLLYIINDAQYSLTVGALNKRMILDRMIVALYEVVQ